MKMKLTALLLVILGSIIGFILGTLNSYKAICFFADLALFNMAVDVYDLQQGQCETVLERKKNGLPRLVQQYESDRKFIPEEQWNGTLWAVARCYEDQEGGPPASIKHILDALPPRPLTSCDIKRNAAKEKE